MFHAARSCPRSLPAVVSTLVAIVSIASVVSLTSCKKPDAAPAVAEGPPLVGAPAEASLTNDSVSVAVRRGRALVNSTADSLATNVGNELRCTSCHLSDGRRAFAMPLVGASVRYPQPKARSGKTDQLSDRINDCVVRSLNGRALDPTGRDMHDIVAYITWLSKDVVAGGRVEGQGIDSIASQVPDTTNGAKVYAARCARCHGANGSGAPGPRLFLGSENTVASPLWGPKSFTIGSEMARIRVAAAFIARQMPLESPTTLTPQQAYDLAGFIVAKPRPDFASKGMDWPNGGAPPDVPYQTDFAAKNRAKP
jgi:thiosulfate dehydrogenase